LEIAPTLLTATVQVESADGSDEAFPHIYGAINRDAVMNATHLRVRGNGRLEVADAL
jgi:uncharacterized protein (DUF952 family)